jgi:hypothetical protein
MNKTVSEFIHSKKINSIPKLNLLLFLYRNPKIEGTSHCFAEQLYLGDVGLVEGVIRELIDKGVIKSMDQRYFLVDAPEIKSSLQDLATSFEHPLTRQTLLAQIQSGGRNNVTILPENVFTY